MNPWPALSGTSIRRHGLPIGNLTSQFFANIHLDGFDHFVKQALGVKGYVRYVDDFLIFAESREQARAWGRQAKAYLEARRMEIHPDKYRLCRTDREGADFCGFVCFANGRIGNVPEAAGSASGGRLRCMARYPRRENGGKNFDYGFHGFEERDEI